MTTTDLSKSDIRQLLWDVSLLGSTLASVSDDDADEVDLDLDSLTQVWLVTQLERRTGLAVSEQVTVASLQSVNAIHEHLLRCRQTG